MYYTPVTETMATAAMRESKKHAMRGSALDECTDKGRAMRGCRVTGDGRQEDGAQYVAVKRDTRERDQWKPRTERFTTRQLSVRDQQQGAEAGRRDDGTMAHRMEVG